MFFCPVFIWAKGQVTLDPFPTSFGGPFSRRPLSAAPFLESVWNDIFVQNDILVRNDIFVSEGHFKKKSFTRKKNFSQPFSCLKTISVSPLWPKDSKYAIRFEIRGREGGEKNEHTNPRTISNFNIDGTLEYRVKEKKWSLQYQNTSISVTAVVEFLR